MIVPNKTSWVKQFRHCSGSGINSGQVRTFVQVAIDAGQGQVIEVVRAAMNLWDDVFDVKHCKRRAVLMKMTILTGLARSRTRVFVLGNIV